jgi:hypothetical protein
LVKERKGVSACAVPRLALDRDRRPGPLDLQGLRNCGTVSRLFVRPHKLEVARARHAQPIQATAVQDAQLAGRVEKLGAEDGILAALMRR